MKSIKLSKLIGIFSILIATCFMFAAPTFATGDPCSSTVSAVREANGCDGSSNALPDIITNIINAVIAVIGLAAVIAIVYGGAQYISSAGNAEKTQKAKRTILYAVIGLIVCALSFIIVNFVIKQIL